jgi:hypothetical protein
LTRTLVALLACVVAVASPACGGSSVAPASQKAYAEPHWQDVFESMPELVVVVRARAAREDRIYGPLLRRALQAAREHSRAVAETGALDAMGDAEELVLGLRPDSPDHPGELVLVARGVRADIDPAKLVDDEGRGLWLPGPPGRVPELVRETDAHGHPVGASLFVLPGRTWVIAQGPARVRAREAFAHPFNRPPLQLDALAPHARQGAEPNTDDALGIVRIDGPALVARVRALQDLGGLAAVGRRLRSVALELPPGAEHSVRATFAYSDDDSAAASAVTVEEAIQAISRSKRESLAWLGAARVDRAPRSVVVTSPLPGRLIDALLHAGSAPLDLDGPPTP